MPDELPFAETVNYWKSSQQSSDTWLEKTKDLIAEVGGEVLADGFASEAATGRQAFMLHFRFGGEQYRCVWPVLPTRSGKEARAAKTQVATFLFHDVKARCMKIKIFGVRSVFLDWLLLPDGRTASQASAPELARDVPALFTPPTPRLLERGIVDLADETR